MSGRRLFLASAVLLAAGWSGAALANGIFLAIQTPNIQGEATTVGFENQIEVLSGAFGAYNPACSGSKGSLSVSEFSFTKYTDKASVDMFAAMRDRTVFGDFTFRYVRTVMSGDVVYQTYTFHNAILSAGSTAGSSTDARTVESWTISFSDVTLEYTYWDNAGKNGGTESVSITPPVCPGS